MTATDSFDVIVVGTSFASSFFLLSYLKKAPPNARVVVLEKFPLRSHRWQLENRDTFDNSSGDHFDNLTPQKPWIYGPAFGGGSNCWWACVPRFMPADFKLHSKYGVGSDWPLSYDDLEEYYCQVEEVMAVAGDDAGKHYPRSRPLPQPPHRLSKPEEMLKAAFPGKFFPIPCARPRIATKNRPACCGSAVCRHCPVDSKFTVLNEMNHLYQDPRVTLILEAAVQSVEYSGNSATGVSFIHEGKQKSARADLIVLGANGIFNPHILLRSGLKHRLLGKRLHEQVGVSAVVDLDGVDNFQGSTSLSGHGYMFYDGPHRAQHAACVVETSNVPENLRLEPRKWRQRLQLKFVFEDLPLETNFVGVSEKDPTRPAVSHSAYSEYAERAMARVPALLAVLLKPLPVERIVSTQRSDTQNHIQGTTVMGVDPAESIVDKNLIHHQLRNLLVLGSSTFPSCSPVNPTLTIAALSLRTAETLMS